MPQKVERYRLSLLSFRFVCSKLQLLFLNTNIKINDLFYPNVCGLKAIFSYINGSKFLLFLILLVFFVFFFLLELISTDQVPSVKSAKIKPRKIKVLTR